MELLALGKEMLHSLAETAASYKLGQAALRQADRALWVLEKCSKWSLPVDTSAAPPELVRPLPWLLFLALLAALRASREALSLLQLARGQPPLRAADVVVYFQSKRRYLRTLKYQGTRAMRSRTSQLSWSKGIQALLETTMCFKRSERYGNNNTTQISNNDEILVVKRSKRGSGGAAGAGAESTMDRLITKMMADLDDDDDDSTYTLTNATSENSLTTAESDHELPNGASTPTSDNSNSNININNITLTTLNGANERNSEQDVLSMSQGFMSMSQTEDLSIINAEFNSDGGEKKALSMIDGDRKQVEQARKFDYKIANGRVNSRVPKKSKGQLSERRDSDVPLVRITANDTP